MVHDFQFPHPLYQCQNHVGGTGGEEGGVSFCTVIFHVVTFSIPWASGGNVGVAFDAGNALRPFCLICRLRKRGEGGKIHVKSNTSCSNRLAAISQYFSSISMPIALRRRSLAARRVVPLPMKGSRMTSASLENCFISSRINPTGF